MIECEYFAQMEHNNFKWKCQGNDCLLCKALQKDFTNESQCAVENCGTCSDSYSKGKCIGLAQEYGQHELERNKLIKEIVELKKKS